MTILRRDDMISSSLEDYLEAIAEIVERNQHAHTKDIAEHLKVTMPSVTNAIQTLAANNLVKYQSHMPVTLTAAGAERAAVIRRRHAVLRKFFAETLLLPAAKADVTACKIEHLIGEVELSRLTLLAEAVSSRPDCEGLRAYLTEVMPKVQPEAPTALVTLDRLPADHRGIVARVDANLRGLRKFADLGLVPGTLVEFVGGASSGDTIRIKAMGTLLTLRRSDAAHIWLTPVE